ncbi:MAG: MoxR family ATPase [Neisseriaceae bacterium]|nr:MoxR family ATPase [Neisseriaceae bacterium]
MNGLEQLFKQLNNLLLGKSDAVKLAVACILARGHLLLEDIPGVGKTTLAHGLAACLGLDYRRVQFTNDMLPADLLGVSIFRPNEGKFMFQPGPVFHRFLLADEINRASPKVQSALLEAMEEQQVSIDNKTYALPQPFMVIATQNPAEQIGTFPLPESQLDRFLMRVSIGYPVEKAEKYLYQHGSRRNIIKNIQASFNADSLISLQQKVAMISLSDAVADYIYRLVNATRVEGIFTQGLSPRAGLALVQAAKAWAVIEGRDVVLPEDVKAVFIAVTSHRLKTLQQGNNSNNALQELLHRVVVA